MQAGETAGQKCAVAVVKQGAGPDGARTGIDPVIETVDKSVNCLATGDGHADRDFLIRVLADSDFQAGTLDTGFIAAREESLLPGRVRADDSASVRELDQEIVGIWETIVEFDPQNDEEKRIMANFFLDQLISDDDRNQHNHTIREKFLALV